MTLEQARLVVREQSPSLVRQMEAASVLAASKKTELGDLIRCLRLGGLAAETAATALYSRTGRPYSGRVEEFSADAAEWTQYLAKQLELAAG
jgi:hypothetical protein